VFAVVLTETRPPDEVERLAARLGLAGADKVLFCEGPGLDKPPLEATHGPALYKAVERVHPLLVLFPSGGAGAHLGPPLAVRMGAAYAAAADVEVADSPNPLPDSVGRVQVRRWRRDRSSYRRLDPVEMERPVIAVLGAHGGPAAVGTAHAEVDVLECKPGAPGGGGAQGAGAGAPGAARVVELETAPDADAAVALARVLVLVESANPKVGAEAAAKLAAAAAPGVVIADLARVSAAAVAASTPHILVCVGTAEIPAAPSPQTRVGMVLVGDAGEPPRGSADVIWRVSGDVGWDDLAGALGRLQPPPAERGA
jgi:hypothetical protein